MPGIAVATMAAAVAAPLLPTDEADGSGGEAVHGPGVGVVGHVVVGRAQGDALVEVGAAAGGPGLVVVGLGLPRFPRTPSQWFSGTTGRCPMANVYSQEFKDQIVEQHRQGRTFVELAKEFNLAATSISNWVRAADKRAAAEKRSRNNAGDSEEESDKAKVRRLERELARKEEELEILGKALAFFARRTDL